MIAGLFHEKIAEIDKLKNVNSEYEDQILHFTAKVMNRDQEISSLGE